jgi:hypothetical protein
VRPASPKAVPAHFFCSLVFQNRGQTTVLPKPGTDHGFTDNALWHLASIGRVLKSILQCLLRIYLPPVAPAAVFTLLASLGENTKTVVCPRF